MYGGLETAARQSYSCGWRKAVKMTLTDGVSSSGAYGGDGGDGASEK